MKKDFFVFAAVLTVLFLAFSGCSKDSYADENANEKADENVTEIVGSSDFLSSISCLSGMATKAGEISEEEMEETIKPLFASAKEYLTLNGYNYLEDFEEDDPRIIMTAYTLLGVDFAGQTARTKSVTEDIIFSSFDVLECVVFGKGAKKWVDGKVLRLSASQIAKLCAKQVAKYLPYVGTVVMVITAGTCIYRDISGRIIEKKEMKIIEEIAAGAN